MYEKRDKLDPCFGWRSSSCFVRHFVLSTFQYAFVFVGIFSQISGPNSRNTITTAELLNENNRVLPSQTYGAVDWSAVCDCGVFSGNTHNLFVNHFLILYR